MNLLLKILDYAYLTRPILFFPGWTTLIAGYLNATGENYNSFPVPWMIKPVFWDSSLILSIIALGCAMGGGAVLNQLKDIETDQRNKKLFLLDNKYVPVSHAFIESILLIFTSLLIAIKLGWQILGLMLTGIVIAGYIYNFPPFNLKNHPIGGLWANIMMGWLVFVVGWLLIQPLGMVMLKYSLPYLLYNTALYLLTTLPDLAGDSATGKITIPVRYGFNNTVWFSFLLFLLAAVIAVWFSDGFLFILSLIVFPFFVSAVAAKTMPAVILAIKMGIFFFSLGICFKFPPFLGMIVLAFFVTRFYYKRRFGFDYPTFKGI
jgi:4-hydroxybenzoate polyprenyltransferase